MRTSRILVYGYGNPGRYDDGIGPEIAEQVEIWALNNNLSHINTDSNYQLNIEDAYTIKDYDIVIFVDASVEPIDNFCITDVQPSDKVEFTMHSVSPSFIADLCKKMYNKSPDIYLLHIRGYMFEFKEGTSEKARHNMKQALAFLTELLKSPEKLLQIPESQTC